MKITGLLLFALLLTGVAQAEVAIPPLVHRVTDLTSTLDGAQTQAIESRLASFETQKGAQIAVLIVASTQPETIEQFGIRVTDAWKLGRKGTDDGILLLVAKDDHTLRIEVGYGLEGAMNDATANRIINEVIVPSFKRGEFYQGIDAGVSAIIKVVSGEPLPPPVHSTTHGRQDVESMLFVAFGIAVVGGGILRALIGRLPAALLVGGALGGLAWFAVASSVVALLAGIAAFVFVLLGSGRGGVGGFGGGGFGGSGGFGGGGGGFGGGGASGRW
ncbi:MAG: YgcG family protein [Gallionella sp.]|nr:YgcG family protein [Gallionella sp.]